MNMKREIMLTKRYEEVLDMLEKDGLSITKLTEGERSEISRDGRAMEIAVASNVRALAYASRKLKSDKGYMYHLINDVNPLAMFYCYTSWFRNKYFVENMRSVALRETKKYNISRLGDLYNKYIDKKIQQAKNVEIEK